MNKLAPAAVLVATSVLAAAAPLAGADDLIPRDVLFGNPDRAVVRLSPDGKYLSWSAPVDGVLNLWVAPADDPAAALPVTRDTGRGVTSYFWSYTGRHLLYLQDEGGNENFNLYAVVLGEGDDPVASAQVKPLAVDDAVRVQVAGVSDRHPSRVVVGLNDRVPMFHDLHVLDLLTGEKTLLAEHPGTLDGRVVAGLGIDDDYRVRFASAFDNDGGIVVFTPATTPADAEADEIKEWEQFEKVDFEDTMASGIRGFTRDADVVYETSSAGRNTAALFERNLATGERKLVAEDDLADAGGLLAHPTEKTVQAVSFDYDKTRWHVVDGRVAPDVATLGELAGDGEWGVLSRSMDDARWVVFTSASDGPTRYYLYDRNPEAPGSGEATFLFTNNSRVEQLADEGRLATMHPVVIEARDGLPLVSYLTLPHAADVSDAGGVPVPAEALPMVLVVHGGPWARDSYGFAPDHQWLADRGYAVLAVNFRGSTGLGKKHLNAGNKQWGRAMQDDLTDAVNWAVDKGIADKDKVAIMGGSYGGYAALAGLTLTPDVYAAGVSIVGPSSILTLLDTIPPYWAPAVKLFHTRVGNPGDPEERQMLEDVSPLNHVERIRVPLLIGQGANDPRVKQAESDQIVSAMQQRGVPVTYVLYPDEGHGFARPPNRLSFFGVAEAFLAEHLGGRFQPLTDDDLAGSSMVVPEGKDGVPGLAEVMSDE